MAQLVTGYTFRPIQQPDTDRELFREIRELRKVTFAWQLAGEREDIAEQAKYRLACLRGEHGPRPWDGLECRKSRERRSSQIALRPRQKSLTKRPATSPTQHDEPASASQTNERYTTARTKVSDVVRLMIAPSMSGRFGSLRKTR